MTEVIDYHEGPVSEQLSAPVDAVLDPVVANVLDDAPEQGHTHGKIGVSV
ncbi:MAG TPA: hypothetical protein VFG63_09740 [Nocardioidaceae bacterium]|nr:hypothetical protein [Nocardioidaceae bacterium]